MVQRFLRFLTCRCWLTSLHAAACVAGVLAILAVITTARAQDVVARTGTALDAAIKDWMKQNQVPAAALAAMKGNIIVKTGNYGMDPEKPARVASLSKAITGVCVARLVDEGRLAFTTPLGTALAKAFKTAGEPVDPRFKSITIEQLLMHRAGLAREPARGPPAHDMTSRFRATLATPLAADPSGAMSYSNIGYLTLGMIVEAATGSSYERHCRATVLAPMKAAGSVDPALRERAPNGGWKVSAVDYAKFVQVFEPNTGVLGPAARQWIASRTQKPLYSLGSFMRQTAQGTIFSHSGRVAARDRGGAYMIKFDNGWTTVVEFEGDVDSSGYTQLRDRLFATVSKL